MTGLPLELFLYVVMKTTIFTEILQFMLHIKNTNECRKDWNVTPPPFFLVIKKCLLIFVKGLKCIVVYLFLIFFYNYLFIFAVFSPLFSLVHVLSITQLYPWSHALFSTQEANPILLNRCLGCIQIGQCHCD